MKPIFRTLISLMPSVQLIQNMVSDTSKIYFPDKLVCLRVTKTSKKAIKLTYQLGRKGQ